MHHDGREGWRLPLPCMRPASFRASRAWIWRRSSAPSARISGTKARTGALETGPKSRPGQRVHVVAYDFGIKRNILRCLADQGCRITVVPAQTPADRVLAMNPEGIFLSNGPGDPEPCTYAIEAIKAFLETDIPMFGICLGHQLLGLASDAKTVKMKFGHHGANHPVLDIASGRVLISSQNHGFAVDESTLGPNVRTTHKSLFDGSLQGIERDRLPRIQFPGPSGGSPGPHEVRSLFTRFMTMIHERINSQSAAEGSAIVVAAARTR